LLGILPAEYQEPHDEDWLSALGPACDQIHEALGKSACKRGDRSLPLAMDILSDCVDSINRVMRHITTTIATSGSSQNEFIEDLPEQGGFIVHRDRGQDMTLRFGRIEECRCEGPGSVIALPANEFFEDECITDPRSALGSF